MTQPLPNPADAPAVTAPSRPHVLVIARDTQTRDAIAAMLESDVAIRSISPEALGRPGAWVDAVAVVALLDEGAEALKELSALRELPAGRAMLLLPTGLSERAVEEAIGRLGPALVLPHPSPAAALRLALQRIVPPAPGAGARAQQRRAPALLGVSSVIREVVEQIRQVADTRITVLILGETGTGKELVARAIHEQGPRAARPFVAVNCSAMPDTLLEAELFGVRKGAYTGADRDRKGLFQEADGGTLFLDEVGETSPAFQAKLLRVLETGEIRRLGANDSRKVDVRIVSATHRDLEAAIEEDSFRRDLFYRLNTVAIYIPPLRRRRIDIPFLAQHFAEEFGDAHARRIVLDEAFLNALAEHEFPGNVRELRNAVERAIALASPDTPVGADHLQLGAGRPHGFDVPRQGTLRERLEQVETQAIREALAELGGNRTRVAEALGLSRLGLRQKMRRLGLEDTVTADR